MSDDPAQTEVPWFSEPPEAVLRWSTPSLGHLHFVDPRGERATVPVTPGESYVLTARSNGGDALGSPVWHVEVSADGSTATVSPSIHFVGRWHSSNPVQFKLVEDLDG